MSENAYSFSPRDIPAILGVGFLRLASLLPLPCLHFAGRILGRLAYYLFPYRKSVAVTNLSLCFPDWSNEKMRSVLRAHYEAMGIGVFELGYTWFRSGDSFKKTVEIVGLEHLEALQKEKRGALLLSAHFTTLEFVGRTLVEHVPLSCLYRKPNQPYIAQVMTERRASMMRRVIHFNDMRGLFQTLKEGDFIWYGPDQGKRIKYSAILPFFGVPARTNTATVRIAKAGNAAIIPFFGYRKPDGSYKLEIMPEMKELYDLSPEEAALRINQWIEAQILKAPEQYFWLHRKFKRRGEGYPNLYGNS